MKGYLGEFPSGLVWPVNPKRNQSWIFFGRTDAKAEAPILWSLDAESIHGKRPWHCERLKAEEEGEDRGWDGWIGITNSMDMSLSKIWGIVKDRKPGVLQTMPSPRGHDEANWTTTTTTGGLVVRIWGFHCPRSIPVQETRCHKPSGQKKKKERKKERKSYFVNIEMK